MSTTDILDGRIRELIAELIESAPQAPDLSDLDWSGAQTARRPGASHRRAPRASVRLLVGGVGITVAAVVALVVVLPEATPLHPLAAAAELRLIASNAVDQSQPQPGNGQWLSTEQQVSFAAHVAQVGATRTPGAQATMEARIEQWSDENGDACTSADFGIAQFASAADRSAWTAAGLLTTPVGQPATGCTTVEGSSSHNTFDGGAGSIDVARLPTDPSALAQELTAGTTGIGELDHLGPQQQENPGFESAAILLVGPTANSTPAAAAALFQALALIPGIDLLGQVTTHSGATGLGFAAGPAPGSTAIIVDPSTGILLEARNIPTPVAFNGLISSYESPTSGPTLGTEGGVYGTSIQWLDPIGSPRVVGTGSLPSNLDLPQQLTLTGTIVATARPDVTFVQLLALKSELAVRFGAPSSSGYSTSVVTRTQTGASTTTSSAAPGESTGFVLAFTFNGPKSQLTAYASALQASMLFASVDVQGASS